MSNLTKKFNTLSEARGFAAQQGVLVYESYRVGLDGLCHLTWRPLRLSPDMGRFDEVTMGREYPVLRESEHAYMIRNDVGKIVKVNRYTMMGGKAQFTTH